MAALDGMIIPGGAINGNAKQIGYGVTQSPTLSFIFYHYIFTNLQISIQLASGLAGMTYSFVVTLLILIVIHWLSGWFPSLKLRAHIRPSERGLDEQEFGDPEAVCLIFPVPLLSFKAN